MSELTRIYGFTLAGAAMMLALVGLGIAIAMQGVDRWNKRFFIAFFSVLVLYVGFAMADGFLEMQSDSGQEQMLVYYFETLFASTLIPMMTVDLLHCCGEDSLHSRLLRTVMVLWLVFFVMVTLTLSTTLFYYLGPDGQFQRGPLYTLLTAVLDAILFVNLFGVINRKERLSKRYFYAFLIGLLPMTIVLFVHSFVPVFSFMGIGVSIYALSMFGIILSDQEEQFLHQRQQIANQRASIMVLQMRPHFIYNTMMSIYYLCKQDPDLAQRVTLDFTTYLRKNFTAIASEEPIPFSEELEHARAYLAVEQTQFDDRLYVDYDTPHLEFRLPPLTLQPIVENAVKHGMDPDGDPLRVMVRTRKTDKGSVVVVENSGADFQIANDSEPHVALRNIQQRLEMMCDGKMTITPRVGGGTVVEVTIP